MMIDVVVDRVENGYAVLRSQDFGIEISIPVDVGDKKYSQGESVSLIINKDGLIEYIG